MKSFTYKAQDLKKYFVPYKWEGNDFTGCDCYGFVELWYKNELGIVLPSYSRMGKSFRDVNPDFIEQHKNHKFYEVQKPETHDIVYMKDSFGLPRHVGVFVSGHIFHCTSNCGTLFQRASSLFDRIISFHRYKYED